MKSLKVWNNPGKSEKVWKSLESLKSVRKSEKVWESLRKSGKVWESLKSLKKSGKVWESLESLESLRKSEKVWKVWKSLRKSEKVWKVWKNLKKSGKSLRFFSGTCTSSDDFRCSRLFMQLSDHVNTLFVLIPFFLCILVAFKLIDTSVKLVRVLLFFSLSHGRIDFGVISVALGRYKNLPQPIRLNKTTTIINTSFVFVGCSRFSSFPH